MSTLALALGAVLAAADAPALPPLPAAVSSFGAAPDGTHVYVYGGHAGVAHGYSTDTTRGTFHRLPVEGGKTWEELPAGPALQGLALAAAGGKVYRVGGMGPRNKPGEKADLHSVAGCAAYDPAARTWVPFPDLPAGRSSHDLVAVGRTLVVVGGWQMRGAAQESVWHDTALVCDTAAAEPKWTAVPQPFRRRALTAAAVDGKVYVLGGLTETGESVRTVDVFDPTAKTWATVAPFPGTERTGFSPAACEVGGRLVVATMDRGVYALDAAAGAWTKVGEMAEARFVHRLVPKGTNEVVAIGGAGLKGPLASVEAVRLDFAAPPKAHRPAAGPNGQAFCPVMTTDPVTPADAQSVEYAGTRVLLCCGTCVAKFRRDPAAYLDPKFLPALAGRELPARAIEQVYCPVYRDRKVSAKDPFVTYQGVKVYVFNDTAKLRFEKNPAKYADPAVLPQLKPAK